ncbi:MAG: hypothetical protein OEZ01_17610 [Candidatus Heimdallarchaeota archaeon]|nr:hypothetical protein [Candidatus Heimdallarchaeota archaeon]
MALFKDSSQLLEEFPKEQLEAGFWIIPYGPRGSLIDLIYNHYSADYNLLINTKKQLIYSNYDLFANLFQFDPLLRQACYMWWDQLVFFYSPRLYRRLLESDDEDKQIQDALFETLGRILYLDSLDCKLSALHGLNHLYHPNTEELILEFLDDHPDLDSDLETYALNCIDGKNL